MRALAATSGAAALRRGLPVYGGVFALAGLLFGGNGLQAATVVAGAGESALARALLWGAWLVLAAPTVEALWRDAGGFWLRCLPAPRSWHLAVLLGLTIVAEGPWLALWAAGGGPWVGLAALGGALAAEPAISAAGTRNPHAYSSRVARSSYALVRAASHAAAPASPASSAPRSSTLTCPRHSPARCARVSASGRGPPIQARGRLAPRAGAARLIASGQSGTW